MRPASPRPIRIPGGLVVGAIGISGAVDRICQAATGRSRARPWCTSVSQCRGRAVHHLLSVDEN